MKKLHWQLLVFAGAASLALPTAVLSQAYPTKPVRMIVPFPAGGSADFTARLIGSKASETMAQPVVVENRVGASGMIGSELVARAAPDGYTILMTTTSTHITAFFLRKNLPYDPLRDFTPISAAAEAATGLVVTPGIPANSVRELIDYARRNPGKLTYSSAGIGSAFHLTGELFKQAAEVNIVHVPYKGAGQALNDLISGTISMTFSTVASQAPYVKAGKIRLLAVLEPKRYSGLPEVPTVTESLPNFIRPDAWMGFFGPAGMTGPILQRLNAEIVAAVNAQDVKAKLQEVGFSPIGNTPEQFAALIKSGFETYGRAVKAAGLKPE